MKRINKELGDLIEERNQLKGHWEIEKERIQEIRQIKNEIETVKGQADKYEREGDLGKVAELRYGLSISLNRNSKPKGKNSPRSK